MACGATPWCCPGPITLAEAAAPVAGEEGLHRLEPSIRHSELPGKGMNHGIGQDEATGVLATLQVAEKVGAIGHMVGVVAESLRELFRIQHPACVRVELRISPDDPRFYKALAISTIRSPVLAVHPNFWPIQVDSLDGVVSDRPSLEELVETADDGFCLLHGQNVLFEELTLEHNAIFKDFDCRGLVLTRTLGVCSRIHVAVLAAREVMPPRGFAAALAKPASVVLVADLTNTLLEVGFVPADLPPHCLEFGPQIHDRHI